MIGKVILFKQLEDEQRDGVVIDKVINFCLPYNLHDSYMPCTAYLVDVGAGKVMIVNANDVIQVFDKQ